MAIGDYKERGWWKLTYTTETLDDHSREHIGNQIKDGYLQGEIIIFEMEDNQETCDDT